MKERSEESKQEPSWKKLLLMIEYMERIGKKTLSLGNEN